MRYKLHCGYSTGTVDTLGGELVSYCNRDREIIWHGSEKSWTGHAPVLFPFVSALEDGVVYFGEHKGSHPGKHGFARKSEFELVEITDTKAVFKLVPNEKTREFYPFDFELYVTHEITEDTFKTTYKVVNSGNVVLPFCLGGHPGFFIDDSIEHYKLVFEKPEDSVLYYTDERSMLSDEYDSGIRIKGTEYIPKYSDFDRDALVMKDVKSQKVKLISQYVSRGIVFDFTGFPVLVLWTPPKKEAPFMCLEPWQGLPAIVGESGQFTDKPYCIKLDPGKEYEAGYKVTVL